MSPKKHKANPVFLLAGGPGSRTRNPDPLLQTIFAASAKSKPSIAYLGSASGDDRDFFEWTAHYFKQSGAGPVKLASTVGPKANLDKAKEVIESADIVYVSGGDVEAGIAVIAQIGLQPFLEELFKSGKRFFGLSAGSIILAQAWVRWEDPDDDATACIFPCLNFAPLLCDTHAEKEGWEELQALLSLGPDGTRGYGIPSGGGLCVNPNGSIQAMGKPVHCFIKKTGIVQRLADLAVL
jgi:peptidase E